MSSPPDRPERGKRGRKPARRTPSSEEGMVFPAEGEPTAERRGGPITLPSSGLAADILALAGAAAVPAAVTARAPLAVPDAAEPDAPPRAHNISFFAAPVREERK